MRTLKRDGEIFYLCMVNLHINGKVGHFLLKCVCWQVLFGGLTVDVMTAGTWSLSMQRLVDIESCWCRSVVEYVISTLCQTQQWCHSASNDGLLLLMNPSTSPSAPLITKQRPLASIGLSGTMRMWAHGGGAKWLTSSKLLFGFYNCITT